MPTTTSSNPLWDLQAQYLPGTFQSATELYNQGAPAIYSGQTVADLDPVKTQGLNLGVDAALGAQTDLANTYATQLGGIAGGTDPYTQQLAQQAAGATNFGFGQAGTLGSARHSAAANQAASNTIADRQLSALGQIPQAQAAALTPGQSLSQIGGQTQDYAQSLIDADKQKYEDTVNQPYNWLKQYQSALAPGGFNAPTTTNQKATGLETATGIVGLLGGLGGLFGGGFFAEGGDTTRAWAGPTPSHSWQMVDGRYQLVATPGGSQTGGFNNGAVATGYVPSQIGYDAAGNTQLSGSGGSAGGAAIAGASGAGTTGGSEQTGILDADGNYVPGFTPGADLPFVDPVGTHTDISGGGTNPTGSVGFQDVNFVEDNYTNVPNVGEAFGTTYTGTDSQGNPYSQPTLVVDSSNAGDLSNLEGINYGAVTPYDHLNPGDPGLIGNLINNSTLGTVISAITGEDLVQGDTPYHLSSTNQLGQQSSVSTGGTYQQQPDGSYAYVNEDGSQSDFASGHDVNNDGNPFNDTGNAGWGFTSIGDAFDGGGPGASGDTYTGGIWGDKTVGDTSQGVSSILTGATRDPAPVQEAPSVPEWEQAGFSSKHKYDNQIVNEDWGNTGFETIKVRSGYNADGEYGHQYQYDGQTYDNLDDTLAVKTTAENAADIKANKGSGDVKGIGGSYYYDGKKYNDFSGAYDAKIAVDSAPKIQANKGSGDVEYIGGNYYYDGKKYDSRGDADIAEDKADNITNGYVTLIDGDWYYGGQKYSNYGAAKSARANPHVDTPATTSSGKPKYINTNTGGGSDDGPSAAAIAAANVSSPNTQVQSSYSGPSHGYDDSSSWSAPARSTPSYSFGSAYNYAEGGTVKPDYGWGM